MACLGHIVWRIYFRRINPQPSKFLLVPHLPCHICLCKCQERADAFLIASFYKSGAGTRLIPCVKFAFLVLFSICPIFSGSPSDTLGANTTLALFHILPFQSRLAGANCLPPERVLGTTTLFRWQNSLLFLRAKHKRKAVACLHSQCCANYKDKILLCMLQGRRAESGL